MCVFFFNDTAATEIYTLSLHDALPILRATLATEGTGLEWRAIDLEVCVCRWRGAGVCVCLGV